MVNVGIIGLGFMAAMHIRAYRQIPNARISAICNPSGKRLDGDLSDVAGNLAEAEPLHLDMSEIRPYCDIDAFLADESIDLVDICSPTKAHVSQCIAALDAGKHVICEKPLARTPAEVRKIVDAATTSRGFFMPAMCLRFWPEWSHLKQIVDAGTYGKILSARFRRVAEAPAWGLHNYLDGKASGGGLLDLHIHDSDFVNFLFGRPKAVFSQGYSLLSGCVDHVVSQYVVENGAVVSAEGSWAMTPGFGFNMAYTATFEEATLDYDFAREEEALKLYRPDQDCETIKFKESKDGYFGELTHLLDCIESSTPPSVVTPADGLIASEICDAEERSVAAGKLISL